VALLMPLAPLLMTLLLLRHMSPASSLSLLQLQQQQ